MIIIWLFYDSYYCVVYMLYIALFMCECDFDSRLFLIRSIHRNLFMAGWQ